MHSFIDFCNENTQLLEVEQLFQQQTQEQERRERQSASQLSTTPHDGHPPHSQFSQNDMPPLSPIDKGQHNTSVEGPLDHNTTNDSGVDMYATANKEYCENVHTHPTAACVQGYHGCPPEKELEMEQLLSPVLHIGTERTRGDLLVPPLRPGQPPRSATYTTSTSSSSSSSSSPLSSLVPYTASSTLTDEVRVPSQGFSSNILKSRTESVFKVHGMGHASFGRRAEDRMRSAEAVGYRSVYSRLNSASNIDAANYVISLLSSDELKGVLLMNSILVYRFDGLRSNFKADRASGAREYLRMKQVLVPPGDLNGVAARPPFSVHVSKTGTISSSTEASVDLPRVTFTSSANGTLSSLHPSASSSTKTSSFPASEAVVSPVTAVLAFESTTANLVTASKKGARQYNESFPSSGEGEQSSKRLCVHCEGELYASVEQLRPMHLQPARTPLPQNQMLVDPSNDALVVGSPVVLAVQPYMEFLDQHRGIIILLEPADANDRKGDKRGGSHHIVAEYSFVRASQPRGLVRGNVTSIQLMQSLEGTALTSGTAGSECSASGTWKLFLIKVEEVEGEYDVKLGKKKNLKRPSASTARDLVGVYMYQPPASPAVMQHVSASPYLFHASFMDKVLVANVGIGSIVTVLQGAPPPNGGSLSSSSSSSSSSPSSNASPPSPLESSVLSIRHGLVYHQESYAPGAFSASPYKQLHVVWLAEAVPVDPKASKRTQGLRRSGRLTDPAFELLQSLPNIVSPWDILPVGRQKQDSVERTRQECMQDGLIEQLEKFSKTSIASRIDICIDQLVRLVFWFPREHNVFLALPSQICGMAQFTSLRSSMHPHPPPPPPPSPPSPLKIPSIRQYPSPLHRQIDDDAFTPSVCPCLVAQSRSPSPLATQLADDDDNNEPAESAQSADSSDGDSNWDFAAHQKVQLIIQEYVQGSFEPIEGCGAALIPSAEFILAPPLAPNERSSALYSPVEDPSPSVNLSPVISLSSPLKKQGALRKEASAHAVLPALVIVPDGEDWKSMTEEEYSMYESKQRSVNELNRVRALNALSEEWAAAATGPPFKQRRVGQEKQLYAMKMSKAMAEEEDTYKAQKQWIKEQQKRLEPYQVRKQLGQPHDSQKLSTKSSAAVNVPKAKPGRPSASTKLLAVPATKQDALRAEANARVQLLKKNGDIIAEEVEKRVKLTLQMYLGGVMGRCLSDANTDVNAATGSSKSSKIDRSKSSEGSAIYSNSTSTCSTNNLNIAPSVWKNQMSACGVYIPSAEAAYNITRSNREEGKTHETHPLRSFAESVKQLYDARLLIHSTDATSCAQNATLYSRASCFPSSLVSSSISLAACSPETAVRSLTALSLYTFATTHALMYASARLLTHSSELVRAEAALLMAVAKMATLILS